MAKYTVPNAGSRLKLSTLVPDTGLVIERTFAMFGAKIRRERQSNEHEWPPIRPKILPNGLLFVRLLVNRSYSYTLITRIASIRVRLIANSLYSRMLNSEWPSVRKTLFGE